LLELRVSWLPWVLGVVVLAAAGFGAAYVPRRRNRQLRERTAWADARAALDSAAISRDASLLAVPVADDLYTRAELLVAGEGGLAAAEEAVVLAEKADRLWQGAAE
jgi:hypothetical protein